MSIVQRLLISSFCLIKCNHLTKNNIRQNIGICFNRQQAPGRSGHLRQSRSLHFIVQYKQNRFLNLNIVPWDYVKQGICHTFETLIFKLKKKPMETAGNLKLGVFSVSLTVKDLNASKEFYEKLGFTVFAGSMAQNYLIMKNERSLIGLFQGMFEKNILTFNPGWDENANLLQSFEDVREIQHQLKRQGIKIEAEADDNTTGPASIILIDPDGNPILIDQHI